MARYAAFRHGCRDRRAYAMTAQPPPRNHARKIGNPSPGGKSARRRGDGTTALPTVPRGSGRRSTCGPFGRDRAGGSGDGMDGPIGRSARALSVRARALQRAGRMDESRGVRGRARGQPGEAPATGAPRPSRAATAPARCAAPGRVDGRAPVRRRAAPAPRTRPPARRGHDADRLTLLGDLGTDGRWRTTPRRWTSSALGKSRRRSQRAQPDAVQLAAVGRVGAGADPLQTSPLAISGARDRSRSADRQTSARSTSSRGASEGAAMLRTGARDPSQVGKRFGGLRCRGDIGRRCAGAGPP